jgi:citrate synthase
MLSITASSRASVRQKEVRPEMRKPVTAMPEELKPRNIMRADVTINEGFGIEVDGQMKAVFDTKEAAEKDARKLKTRYPMLQVKVYDAVQKNSTVIMAETPDDEP